MSRLSLSTKILLLVSGTVLGLTALVMAAVTMLARQELDHQVNHSGLKPGASNRVYK